MITTSDSITDIDVAVANSAFLRVMRHLPPELVIEYWTRSMDWERDHVLAGRFERYRALVKPVFANVDALSADADTLAKDWARNHFARGLKVVLPLLYADDPRITLRVEGQHHLTQATAGERGPIVVSAHIGPYQAIAAYLARLGIPVTAFMDAHAYELIFRGAYHSLAPALAQGVDIIGLPAEDATRRALGAVRSGRTLVIMPEFSLGDPRNSQQVTTRFMGREVYAPIGAARMARALRVPIIPLRIAWDGGTEITLIIDEPLQMPGSGDDDATVTKRIFAWLESVIAPNPADWWCWEIFDRQIAVSQDDLAGATLRVS